MPGNQIRADFAALEQLTADQGTHAGTVEQYKSDLMSHASKALETLAGGVGSPEHEACMRKVEQLIDEHITATQSFQRTTGTVNDTFLQGGQSARQTFARG